MSLLIKNLVEFFTVLKKSGMDISIQDCMAAIKALQFIDILDRSQVCAALAACLVKKATDRAVFSKAFDLYFNASEDKNSYIREKTETLEKRKQYVEEKSSELCFMEEELELSDEYREIYASLPDEEMKGIKDFLDATSEGRNVRQDFKQLAGTMVKGRLNSLKNKYASRVEEMKGALSYEGTEAGIFAEEVAKEIDTNLSLIHKNIGDMTEEEIPKAIRIIETLIEHLRKELSRRYGKTGKRSTLDIKRTIRSNYDTGQVLFRLKYRSRRDAGTKLLLFCDVSASMTRFSGFVMRLILGLGRSSSSTVCYVFSENTERMNPGNLRNISDFAELQPQGKVWGRGTDIGNSLRQLIADRVSTVSSSTVLVIVSDAKTSNSGLAAEQLELLSKKVKSVIWLNPLPEDLWQSAANIDKYRKSALMLDCSTLDKLSTACRHIVMNT